MQTLIVDNSILKDIAQCKTRGAMLHVLGLTVGKDAIELQAGSAVHEVLAEWAGGAPDEAALTKLRPYEKWAKVHVPPDDDRLAGSNVRRITAHWLKKHPLASFPFVIKPGEIEVPVKASLGTIRGREVTMVALLDAIGKRKTGGRWSIDHKTTRQINQWFKDDQEDASQFTGQLWLAKENGKPLNGVYVNALEYPGLPKSDRTCRTHGGVPYRECALQHAGSQLIPITRSTAEVEAWALTARKLTASYIRLIEKVHEPEDIAQVPMDGRFTRACGRCEFRAWCRVGRPLGAVKTFKKERWNPLEHAEKRRKVVA